SRGSTQYQFDPLGDAVLLLDGSGAVTAHQLHDAWGNPLMTAVGPHGYRARYGYYTDQATGLIALAYRYYGPGVGRFLNRDPVGFDGGVNLYGYALSAPVGFLDVHGRHPAAHTPSVGPPPDWTAPGELVMGFGIISALIGLYTSSQTDTWADDRPGADKKKHCYLCCSMVKYTLGRGYPVAMAMQIIHEVAGGPFGSAQAAVIDSMACFDGANMALVHTFSGCESLCERLVFCSPKGGMYRGAP
ncbi:MAG: RHS repeat-associated core domain-containing protein, partial [Armatimonadetes bacterium]|nr:RHS repeat-associated core domain-containing protein [Armatimonadota bacterium]